MNALEWLRERQEQSERNRRLFENRPNTLRAGEVATHSMIPASQAWSGYEPGGGLMVRQPVKSQPEVKNKLVQKRGDLTMTKEWVDNARFQKEEPDDSYIKVTPLPDDERTKMIPLPPSVYKRGFKPSPAREVSSGWLDRMIRNNPFNRGSGNITGNVPGAQATRPSEVVRASEGPSMEVLPGESIEEARLRIFGRGSPDSPARETWGGDLNLTMPQDPVTRGWIQDPATILNIGNLIKSMGRTFQGVDDRLERNRIRRLMEHRTANPYYRGGLY